MFLPRFEYRRADSLEQASRLLLEAEGHASLMAGGTDLLPRLKYRLSEPALLVGLKGVTPEPPSLSDSGELVLDALTPLAQVAAMPEVRGRVPALAEAALAVGSSQVRNMGTLGGNLCLETRCLYYNQSHSFQFVEPCLKRQGDRCYFAPKAKRCWAVFVADTPPILSCLGAEVEVVGPQGRGRRDVADLYTGDALQPIALDPGEIVARVVIPPAPLGQGSAYAKFALRGGVEFAAVSVAAVVQLEDDGATCRRAMIVTGATGGGPARAPSVEAVLEGTVLSQEAIAQAGRALPGEARPVGHHGYSAAYLRQCLAVQAEEALTRAWERAAGRAAGGIG